MPGLMDIDAPLRFTHSAFKFSYTLWSSTSACDSSSSFSTLTMLLLRSRPVRTVRPGLADFLGLMVDVFAELTMLCCRGHGLKRADKEGGGIWCDGSAGTSVVAFGHGSLLCPGAYVMLRAAS